MDTMDIKEWVSGHIGKYVYIELHYNTITIEMWGVLRKNTWSLKTNSYLINTPDGHSDAGFDLSDVETIKSDDTIILLP